MDQIGIVNLALLLDGEEKINSLTDATKSARTATILYEQARNEIFDLPIPWRFCTARAVLSRFATAPAFGYAYQFALPDNCRRVLNVVDAEGDDFECTYRREVAFTVEAETTTEHDVLLVNESECRIKYIVLRTNPAVYPAWFVKLIALNLAMMLAEPLKQDKAKENQIMGKWQYALDLATAANAQENADAVGGVNSDRGNTDVVDAAN